MQTGTSTCLCVGPLPLGGGAEGRKREGRPPGLTPPPPGSLKKPIISSLPDVMKAHWSREQYGSYFI